MDTVTEKSGAMQAGPIEITERVTEPPPQPKPRLNLTYEASYGDYKVECEMTASGRMVSATKDEPFQSFASANPPLPLFHPAFATWLERFMAECQRRYDARVTAEGR